MTRSALLLTAVAIIATAAPARAQSTTITMTGSVVTQQLIADLAYFSRHDVPRTPRFSRAGGGTWWG